MRAEPGLPPVRFQHLPEADPRQPAPPRALTNSQRRLAPSRQRRPRVARDSGGPSRSPRRRAARCAACCPCRGTAGSPVELHVGQAQADQFRDAQAGGVEHFDQGAVAQPLRRRDVGRGEQASTSSAERNRGSAAKARGALQVVGRILWRRRRRCAGTCRSRGAPRPAVRPTSATSRRPSHRARTPRDRPRSRASRRRSRCRRAKAASRARSRR